MPVAPKKPAPKKAQTTPKKPAAPRKPVVITEAEAKRRDMRKYNLNIFVKVNFARYKDCADAVGITQQQLTAYLKPIDDGGIPVTRKLASRFEERFNLPNSFFDFEKPYEVGIGAGMNKPMSQAMDLSGVIDPMDAAAKHKLMVSVSQLMLVITPSEARNLAAAFAVIANQDENNG